MSAGTYYFLPYQTPGQGLPTMNSGLAPARGRKLLDLALVALCSRNLEIYPLIYASAEDVVVLTDRPR